MSKKPIFFIFQAQNPGKAPNGIIGFNFARITENGKSYRKIEVYVQLRIGTDDRYMYCHAPPHPYSYTPALKI